YLGHGLNADHIWAANGSNEVLLHVMLAFAGPGRTALGFAPTYSMYPEYARDSHTRWVTVDRRADFTLDVEAALAGIADHRPDVVITASPNNPTGTSTDLATIDRICAATDGIVVVDEAYQE